MGRTKKYATPAEAYAAKLQRARENYAKSREGVERKKWGFINTVITEEMVGKTIKEIEAEYKERNPPKQRRTKKDKHEEEETKDETKEEEKVDENNEK